VVSTEARNCGPTTGVAARKLSFAGALAWATAPVASSPASAVAIVRATRRIADRPAGGRRSDASWGRATVTMTDLGGDVFR
jgi:hypothetical protein